MVSSLTTGGDHTQSLFSVWWSVWKTPETKRKVFNFSVLCSVWKSLETKGKVSNYSVWWSVWKIPETKGFVLPV